jgi:signal transduction histidine kinase
MSGISAWWDELARRARSVFETRGGPPPPGAPASLVAPSRHRSSSLLSPAGARRWAASLPWPDFVQSIRFRLTVLYSIMLFALAALVLGGIYLALSHNAEARPITRTYEAEKVIRKPDGRLEPVGTLTVAEVSDVESAVNYQTQRTLRTYSLATLGGLFVASLAIGWVLSGRVLRPVSSIARTAEEIQATDLSRRIRLGGPNDELRRLADTIDSMLGRLDDAFRAQRRLVDDASHELRTPLTIIRANLDSALTNPDATQQEREHAGALVDRATTRMTRLVEDLLATTRRDSPAYSDTDVDLAALAREAGEEADSVAAGRGLEVSVRIEDGLATIGDPDALRRAVGNLLSNAVRLSPPGGEVTVGAGRLGRWLWIAVRDQGPGISDDDQARVFDRFWRGRDAPGGQDGHTGLGLAIVRQIVEAHGGRVRLFSRVGAGSTFVLWLPPADRDPDPGPVPDANPL